MESLAIDAFRDFQGAETFGIEVVTAKEFLERIGALP